MIHVAADGRRPYRVLGMYRLYSIALFGREIKLIKVRYRTDKCVMILPRRSLRRIWASPQVGLQKFCLRRL